MGQPIINIRDQQRASWDKFSPGWRKWDQLTMDFYKPMGDEILKLIAPKEGDIILDIASGTGEPGLTIASTQKQSKVVITDISEGMLAVARETVVPVRRSQPSYANLVRLAASSSAAA